MRLLADGDGNLTSRGSVTGNRLLPSEFMLKIDSATDPLDVNMTIEDGDVTELTVLPPGNPDDAQDRLRQAHGAEWGRWELTNHEIAILAAK